KDRALDQLSKTSNHVELLQSQVLVAEQQLSEQEQEELHLRIQPAQREHIQNQLENLNEQIIKWDRTQEEMERIDRHMTDLETFKMLVEQNKKSRNLTNKASLFPFIAYPLLVSSLLFFLVHFIFSKFIVSSVVAGFSLLVGFIVMR